MYKKPSMKTKLKRIIKASLGKWYTSSLVMSNHQFDSDRGLSVKNGMSKVMLFLYLSSEGTQLTTTLFYLEST